MRSFPILSHAGGDATDEFSSIHSQQAWHMLDQYLVGELAQSAEEVEAQKTREEAHDETTPWVTVRASGRTHTHCCTDN